MLRRNIGCYRSARGGPPALPPARCLLIALVAALLALAAGCIRVPHLADKTGEAYDSVFARQERNAVDHERPKAMEAELGSVASRQLVAGTRGAKSTSISTALAGGPGK